MPGDPEIRAVAEVIFEELLADLVLTTAISAHREVKRGQAICGICGTRCRSHQPLVSTNVPPSSRSSTPQPLSQPLASSSSSSSSLQNGDSRAAGFTVGPEKGTGGSTGIGSGSGRTDASGNVFFDCLVCGRAVASTRYAPHLSSCLGFNGSTRRGASRMAAVKSRLNGNDRSSPSLYSQGSENGDSDVDSVSGAKRGRKPKNGNGKRASSPSKSLLSKKAKLSSISGSATPSHLSRPPIQPSRLGKPTQISPSPSPEKPHGYGGTTGRKTLPGMGGGLGFGQSQLSIGSEISGSQDGEEDGTVEMPIDVDADGDDSSEGGVDDY
ncbi:SAGA-associated factor 11, partial [Tremellales sp. Uapishka_1]